MASSRSTADENATHTVHPVATDIISNLVAVEGIHFLDKYNRAYPLDVHSATPSVNELIHKATAHHAALKFKQEEVVLRGFLQSIKRKRQQHQQEQRIIHAYRFRKQSTSIAIDSPPIKEELELPNTIIKMISPLPPLQLSLVESVNTNILREPTQLPQPDIQTSEKHINVANGTMRFSDAEFDALYPLILNSDNSTSLGPSSLALSESSSLSKLQISKYGHSYTETIIPSPADLDTNVTKMNMNSACNNSPILKGVPNIISVTPTQPSPFISIMQTTTPLMISDSNVAIPGLELSFNTMDGFIAP